jgi:predicted RNA methylase
MSSNSNNGGGAQAARRKELLNGSLDQWFTKTEHIVHYAKIIQRFIGNRPFVDSSCGTGELGYILAKAGVEVRMFDIDDSNLILSGASLPAKVPFEKKNWFDVTLDIGDFCMGFNPPFGFSGRTAKAFAEHAISLGASMICWIVPHIPDKRGRWWIPEGFVERHRELVPDKAFIKNGEERSANTVFVVLERDESAHRALMAEWEQEDAQPLPEGFYIERLSKRLSIKKSEPLDILTKAENELVIRTGGMQSGESAWIWSKDPGYERINSSGKAVYLDPTTTEITVGRQNTHCIVGMPSKFHGKNRSVFLGLAAPIFKSRRRRSANKDGINTVDIRAAIFAITGEEARAKIKNQNKTKERR